MRKKIKIILGLSGGVDSAVAAAILKDRGWKIRAVRLNLSKNALGRGPGRDEKDARAVAEHLDIPYSTLDLSREFEKRVIRPFVNDYLSGITPNPCVHCNPHIKFNALINEALKEGADRIATGHYARINDLGGEKRLFRGKDGTSDQSYFLARLKRPQIECFIAPLGDLTRQEVLRIAREKQIPVAPKPSSQEICFIEQDYRDFLLQREEAAGKIGPGDIVDRSGRVLGRHRGLPFYTIGQRGGLGISWSHPLYVIRIEPEKNRLVVGRKEEVYSRETLVGDLEWHSHGEGEREFRSEVQIRYRHRAAPAVVIPAPGDNQARVLFEAPQPAVTPGQTAVFYRGDLVLGAGTILPDPCV